MSDAFISYSRKDAPFVQRLNRAFVDAQRVVWIDWQDIARGEDWWLEIERGVENADAFICVVSENWLISEICQREMDYATANHKRIIPIIRQKIEGDVEERIKSVWAKAEWEKQARDHWDALRHLNWIFFDRDEVFDTEFPALIKTLESDQPYIKAHTRYQNLALEWERSNQNPSYLLSGDNLVFAESWLKDGATKEPHPTKKHEDFIASSRRAENEEKAQQAAREAQIRRFRRGAVALGVVGVLAVIAAVGSAFIGVQAQQAAATATVAQGAALAQADLARGAAITATLEQGKAQQDAQNARTQVAVAGTTLTAVPPTLTAVASAVLDARDEQDIGLDLANASLSLTNKNTDEALQIVNAMVEAHPQKALAYISRGLIYASTNQADKAIDDYTTAIQLDDKNEIAYINRGNAYDDLNEYDKAIADFDQALALDSENPDTYLSRAGTYRNIEEYDKALADVNEALTIDPENATYLDTRGTIYMDTGSSDEAIADYTQAMTLEPDSADLYHHRGVVYLNTEQYDEALADFGKAIELDPESADVYVGRGDVYTGLEEFDQALTDYSKAIDLDEKNVEAYNGRATVYYAQNQYAEAVADWEQVKALGGTPPPEYEQALKGLEPTATQTPTPMPTATA